MVVGGRAQSKLTPRLIVHEFGTVQAGCCRVGLEAGRVGAPDTQDDQAGSHPRIRIRALPAMMVFFPCFSRSMML
jgi:hypothetical protein